MHSSIPSSSKVTEKTKNEGRDSTSAVSTPLTVNPEKIINTGTKIANISDSVITKSLASSLGVPLPTRNRISNENMVSLSSKDDHENFVTAVQTIDSLLLTTLDRSKQERQFLLDNEEKLVTFLSRPSSSSVSDMEFPPYVSFQRKLLHLLCQRFHVGKEVLSIGQASTVVALPSYVHSSDMMVLRIHRLSHSCVPSVLLRDIVQYAESIVPKRTNTVTGYRKFIRIQSVLPLPSPPPSSSSTNPLVMSPPPLPPSTSSYPPPLSPLPSSVSSSSATVHYSRPPPSSQPHHIQTSSSPSPLTGIIHFTNPTPQGTVINHIIIPTANPSNPTTDTGMIKNISGSNSNNTPTNNGRFFSTMLTSPLPPPPPSSTSTTPPLPLPSINTNLPLPMISSPPPISSSHYVSTPMTPSTKSLRYSSHHQHQHHSAHSRSSPAPQHYIQDQYGNFIPVLTSPSSQSTVALSSVYSPVSVQSVPPSSSSVSSVYYPPPPLSHTTNPAYVPSHENTLPNLTYPSAPMYAVTSPPSNMLSSPYPYTVSAPPLPAPTPPAKPSSRYIHKEKWIQPITSVTDDSLPPSPSISTVTPTKQLLQPPGSVIDRAIISGENLSPSTSPLPSNELPPILLSEEQQQVAIRGHVSLSENGSVVADDSTPIEKNSGTITKEANGSSSSSSSNSNNDRSSQSTVTLPTNVESVYNNQLASSSSSSPSSTVINVPYHINNTGVNFLPVYNNHHPSITNSISPYGSNNDSNTNNSSSMTTTIPVSSLAPEYLAELEARVWQATVQATMETLNSMVQQSYGIPTVPSYCTPLPYNPSTYSSSSSLPLQPLSSPPPVMYHSVPVTSTVPNTTMMMNTVPYPSSVPVSPLWYPPPKN